MKKLSYLLAALVSFFAAMPAMAAGDPSGGVTVIGINRNTYAQALQILMDDMTAELNQSYLYYLNGLALADDPMIKTLNSDARCNSFVKDKLAGQTATNSTDAQKLAAAAAVVSMLQHNSPSTGGLVNRPGSSGWAFTYSHLPRDSNGFRLLQLIYIDGSSATFRLYLPGGSGADPINAQVTAINNIKNAASTTGGAAAPAECAGNS